MTFRSGFIKTILIATLLAGFLFILSEVEGVSQTAIAAPINQENIIQLTNEARLENGRSPLIISPKLNQAAQQKAEDMVIKNYWSHKTPEGKPFWYFADQANYQWSFLGENLAADFKTAEGAISAWLLSPLHRKNILNENYQEIGVGKSNDIVVVLYGAESKFLVLDYLKKFPISLFQFLAFRF